MNPIDQVLREVMSEIAKLIENNEKQQDKVESTNNQKAIDNWQGQKIGLQKAL